MMKVRKKINNSRNYSGDCEAILEELKAAGEKTRLLLHACCAPCSSYCLEYLMPYFDITVFFYNPNMDTEAEFIRRSSELERFIDSSHFNAKVTIERYAPQEFYSAVRGLEACPEGGERCFKCYELRLRESAKYAAKNFLIYGTTKIFLMSLENPPAKFLN